MSSLWQVDGAEGEVVVHHWGLAEGLGLTVLLGSVLDGRALSGQLLWRKLGWFLAGGGGEKAHNLRRFDLNSGDLVGSLGPKSG